VAPTAKILMADDERNILNLAGEALRQLGYEVITVYDGISAYEKAVEWRPDLIILDRHMPGMEGIEVCKKIRENGEIQSTPIIFLTAQDTKEEIIQGYSEGANDYITKPFNMNELMESIKKNLPNTEGEG